MSKGFFSKAISWLSGKSSLEMNEDEKARLAEKRLDSVIDEVEAEGLIDNDAHEMLHGVIDFAGANARKVMVPRTEIVSLELTPQTEVKEIIEIILKSGHSRIPVHNGDIDQIQGLIYAKDLLGNWGAKTIDLAALVREPYFIPETKMLDDLLREFQTKRIHLAFVIDEFGGTSGLVTMEDLIEEIVGEISDEYDDDPSLVTKVGAGRIIVSARLEIDQMFKHFNMEEPKSGFSTVGGWIYNNIGYIPQQGETIFVDGFEVTIEIADARRLKRVKVTKIRKENHETEGSQ